MLTCTITCLCKQRRDQLFSAATVLLTRLRIEGSTVKRGIDGYTLSVRSFFTSSNWKPVGRFDSMSSFTMRATVKGKEKSYQFA